LSGYKDGTYLCRFIYGQHGLFAVDWIEEGNIKELVLRREYLASGSATSLLEE
jgi:hypothetical protein